MTSQGEQGLGTQRCSEADPYGAGLWGARWAEAQAAPAISRVLTLKQPVWEQQGGFLQTVYSPQPPTTLPTAMTILCHLNLPIHNCLTALCPPASSHVPSDHLGKLLVSTEAISTLLLPRALVFTDTDSPLWRDPTDSVSVCWHPISSRPQAVPFQPAQGCL